MHTSSLASTSKTIQAPNHRQTTKPKNNEKNIPRQTSMKANTQYFQSKQAQTATARKVHRDSYTHSQTQK